MIFNITQQPLPAIQEKITVFCLIFLSLLFVLISFERLNSLFIRFVKQHRRLVIISVLVLLIIAIISILNSIDSYWLEAQESELAYLKNTGKKNVESAMKSDKELEALEYSIENGKKLEQLKKQIDSEDTKIKFLGLTLSDQRKVRNDFKKTFKEQLPTETLLNLQKIGDTLYQENRLEHPKSGRSFTSVAFSSDGNKIVTGDNKGELILWKNLEEPSQGTGQRKATPGTIHSLTFSPNNQKIAIGSTNGVMEVWDISNETNTPVRLTGCNATGDVKTLNFSKNDQYLVAGTLEGDICLWDVTDNTFKKSEKIRTKSGEKLKIHKVVFSPDYSRIAVAKSDGQIELRKTNDLTRDESIQPWTLRPLEFIFDLDFNQQGDEIIAAGKSGKVSVFKLEYNGEKPQVIKDFSKELLQSSVEDNPFIKIELQENNQFTVIREYENNLRLLKYDLEKEKQGKTFYLKGYDFKEIDNSKTIINASFNQETQRIVTVANGESVLRIWRVEDKQNYKILETDSERLVNTLSFRDRQGDNRVVGMVTIDNSGKVQFWNEKKIIS
ncbi:MAG: hypothetical protein HRT68_15630 [Flavobacteriaceae bacterium]|nr:hypothetical protein [Flavobacteriaceae bacterium]